jgi:nucleotide-binding universal stress UspA family protein
VDDKPLRELLRTRIFVEVEAREYERELAEQGRSLLERIAKLAELKNVIFEGLLLKGVIHEEVINKTAQLDADLLIMGELKEILSAREAFFNEGEYIFRESPVPVLVVKNPQRAEYLYKEL